MTGSLLGPDGRLIGGPRVEVNDSTVSVTKDGATYSADPEQVLMEMGRAQRDGWSHKKIIAHFQLVGLATSPPVLERALKVGRALLDRAIAEGRAPEHTQIEDPTDWGKFHDDDV